MQKPYTHRTWRVRDPVYGLVTFGGTGNPDRDETDEIARRLIDTREFQRLRRIRQLGFSDLVFPGATHSRFAHSVGVYHTARLLADVIASRGDGCDGERERVALLAALLHDVGHGPFSHAFEVKAVSSRRHEDWSAEIVCGDTEVNRVLRHADATLPDRVGELLKEENAKDIYASIVSSQFDADRIDYMQRDRIATGVEFGHFDRDWLFDCLEVGSIVVGDKDLQRIPCLYLDPKGVSVAEEYLEARFRLYRMVYMHKTTRAAEKMLEKLLSAVAHTLRDGGSKRQEPLLRYLACETPMLGAYLDLDDAAVWSALTAVTDWPDERISMLARRLRDRQLYKCIDIGALDGSSGNPRQRFQYEIERRSPEWIDDLLYDDSKVALYRWYSFDESSALNKILVKTRPDAADPRDIADISSTVGARKNNGHIYRVYAPDRERIEDLRRILREMGP